MTDSKELPIPSKSQVLETLSDYSEEKLREYFHSLFPTSNEDIYTMIDLLWLLTMNSVPGWSFTDKSSEEIDDIFNQSNDELMQSKRNYQHEYDKPWKDTIRAVLLYNEITINRPIRIY